MVREQSTLAEDPVITEWVDAFANCSRSSRTGLYADGSRLDACAVPEEATSTICTWITALGHVCAVRGTPISWMSDEQLFQYCTSPGMIQPRNRETVLYAWGRQRRNFSSCHIYAHRDVGQALRNVCYCDITSVVR